MYLNTKMWEWMNLIGAFNDQVIIEGMVIPFCFAMKGMKDWALPLASR